MRRAHAWELAEEPMLAPRNAPIALDRGALHRIRDGAGLTVLCLKGSLWLTQQDDHRDVVLGENACRPPQPR